MSIEAATTFLERVLGDRTLQATLGGASAATDPQTLAEVVRVAGEAGLVFTASDYQEAIRARTSEVRPDGELDDAELGGVVGGVRSFGRPNTAPLSFERRRGC